jgi:hypothetical protein
MRICYTHSTSWADEPMSCVLSMENLALNGCTVGLRPHQNVVNRSVEPSQDRRWLNQRLIATDGLAVYRMRGLKKPPQWCSRQKALSRFSISTASSPR